MAVRWGDKPLAVLAGGETMPCTQEGTDKHITPEALAVFILANAALTGTPTAPTAAPGTNSTQVASTAFVLAEIAEAIASLVNAAPGALDTLNELAAALGDDENFAATMTAALAGKAALSDVIPAINTQTGTSYTAVLSDRVVEMDNAGANSFTVPAEASVAFPVGSTLELWQAGAGQTTIVADTGVTILYPASKTLALAEQHSGASLRKVAADTWRLVGDLEAA